MFNYLTEQIWNEFPWTGPPEGAALRDFFFSRPPDVEHPRHIRPAPFRPADRDETACTHVPAWGGGGSFLLICAGCGDALISERKSAYAYDASALLTEGPSVLTLSAKGFSEALEHCAVKER